MKLDDFFLETACNLGKKSKCVSKKVGCVIVKDGRIISMGYNGTPRGFKNCCDVHSENFNREKHHEWSNIYEIHAEMNSLLFAAKVGISTNGATLYSTLQPCNQCLKNIIQAGIVRIVYNGDYDKYIDNELISFMQEIGIKIEKYIP